MNPTSISVRALRAGIHPIPASVISIAEYVRTVENAHYIFVSE